MNDDTAMTHDDTDDTDDVFRVCHCRVTGVSLVCHCPKRRPDLLCHWCHQKRG